MVKVVCRGNVYYSYPEEIIALNFHPQTQEATSGASSLNPIPKSPTVRGRIYTPLGVIY
jgi:hypothetical protein